jgi:hypothetical protein
MEDLIASYLIQKKECHLPLLGNFVFKSGPASLDVANKKISPSTDEIIFSENGNYFLEGLKDYVSHRQNIPSHEAEEKINNWCLHAKVKLDAGEKIILDSIGSLQKDIVRNILFDREKDINFYEPVGAEKSINKNGEHAVLVGDKETTSGVMSEFYRDEEVTEKKPAWKIWAIILLAISLLVLIIYFYNHSFSESGIANQSAFPLQQPHATYYIPK